MQVENMFLTTSFHKEWRRRYFILKGNKLFFGKNPHSAPHGMMDLAVCTTVKSADLKSKKRNSFEISTPETCYLLYADTEGEKARKYHMLSCTSHTRFFVNRMIGLVVLARPSSAVAVLLSQGPQMLTMKTKTTFTKTTMRTIRTIMIK